MEAALEQYGRYEQEIRSDCLKCLDLRRIDLIYYVQYQSVEETVPEFLIKCYNGVLCPFKDFGFDKDPFEKLTVYKDINLSPQLIAHLAITTYDYYDSLVRGLCSDATFKNRDRYAK
jgi:hypothetical protein